VHFVGLRYMIIWLDLKFAVDKCRVHSPTKALFILKNTLKFTLKYT